MSSRASAWALLVVSSSKQVDTLDDQRAWAEATARERGWRLAHTVKGVASGKAGPRTIVKDLLRQLRDLAAEDRPAWVLMIRLDRVARGPIVETQLVVHDLKMLGVRVWTREDGELRNETAMEQLLVAVKATVSSQENEVKRDKAIATYAKRRAAKLPVSNQRPLGLRLGDGGKDEPNEPFAEVIRTLFRLRVEGMGLGSIARALLAITPDYTYKNGKTVQVRWTPQRVIKVLEQRAYVGVIVDEVTFQRARRARASGRPATRNANPLAGALHCPCGRTLTSTTWGRSPRRIRYYVCRAVWNHGKLQLGHRADRIEPQFVQMLADLTDKPALIASYSRQARTVSVDLVRRAQREAEARLRDLARERDRIWALNAAGQLRDEHLQERLDAIDLERKDAEARVAELAAQMALGQHEHQRELAAGEVIREAARTFAEALPEDQQRIARLVASTLGGLVVEYDGLLTIRAAEDPDRQKSPRRARTAE
ncbi:MAG: recombinase family protein [Candidatus Eremiobacteraeota bacterium]|nr:recombinase family protein [Candidatus Eremiobacteraeota bacterium]